MFYTISREITEHIESRRNLILNLYSVSHLSSKYFQFKFHGLKDTPIFTN